MSNSLALYDLAPAEDPAPAVELAVVSAVTTSPACDTVGIGVERQGKEGGGVKRAEVRVFIEELKKQRGVVVVGDGGQSLGMRFGYRLDKENLERRRGLSDRLYCGAAVPDIVAGLEDGTYNAARLGNIIARGVNGNV